MELKEFIVETITAISHSMDELDEKGIVMKRDANQYATIDFDVSLVVENKSDKGGTASGGIKLAVFTVGAEGSGSTSNKNESVHRVQFKLDPIHALKKRKGIK